MKTESMLNRKKFLLERLKELTISIGRYPTKEEIDNSYITPHSFSYYKYFKTLNSAFNEINLKLKPKCKICCMEFNNNRALSRHLVKKQDNQHIVYNKDLKELRLNKVKSYNYSCSVCYKKFINEKSLRDHIFNSKLKDESHLIQKNNIREKKFQYANKICPVCNKKLFRNIGMHLNYSLDQNHLHFYKKQKQLVLKLFKELNSFKDIKNFDNILTKDYSEKHFAKICYENLGKVRTLNILKNIKSIKRKNYWYNMGIEERKNIMKKVRDAEWSKLSIEERKNHPWVIAGRLASLNSSKRGSKNQKYMYYLLKQKFPNFNWKYNYTIEDGWHVDIASPEKSIFIEWDGRHHFVPIHGNSYLNNRKNRDRIKNKIIIERYKGCLIRVKDIGRYNPKFVEENIRKISKILNDTPRRELIQL